MDEDEEEVSGMLLIMRNNFGVDEAVHTYCAPSLLASQPIEVADYDSPEIALERAGWRVRGSLEDGFTVSTYNGSGGVPTCLICHSSV